MTRRQYETIFSQSGKWPTKRDLLASKDNWQRVSQDQNCKNLKLRTAGSDDFSKSYSQLPHATTRSERVVMDSLLTAQQPRNTIKINSDTISDHEQVLS
jgi:hypothetical protein